MRQNKPARVLLCVVLSVLLHMVLGLLLLLLPPQERVKHQRKQIRSSRAVQVLRTPARKKADELHRRTQQPPPPQKEKQQPDKEKPSAKTSADTPARRPEQPEYEGRRDTRAASAPDADHRRTDAHAPAQHGEKKDELVTFDQERQEGALEHEGLRRNEPAPPVQPQQTEPAPPAPADAPRQAQNDAPAADGRPDSAPSPEIPPGQAPQTRRTDTTRALTMTDDPDGFLKLRQDTPDSAPAELEQQAARRGTPDSRGAAPTPQPQSGRPRIFYDPSLAAQAQPPGFRTYERRSRSSGRFVLGRGAALNVASTPRGMYEALVYRRVAHFWYIACDEHRGDIIPGKITISVRINKRGRIDSMELIRRSGASISQQSFTFKAIRKASLPPMPAEVQADVIGELMELIFEFNFD